MTHPGAPRPHFFESVLRRRRVLNITTWIAAAVSGRFAVMELVTGQGLWRIAVIGAGPVAAGVVGSRRFLYDVWGDAINVASRMESTGVEGRIQMPQDVYERLNDQFLLEDRGEVEVKGKGMMHTWFLVAQREFESLREARATQHDGGVPVIRTPAPLG